MYIPTNDEMIFHSAHLYVSIHTSYTYVERKLPILMDGYILYFCKVKMLNFRCKARYNNRLGIGTYVHTIGIMYRNYYYEFFNI